MSTSISFMESMKQARSYGLAEFFEIMGELSQESTKKGEIERLPKELITLGIALVKDCNRCIRIHTSDARKLGATDEDIAMVRKIVLYFHACPDHAGDLFDAWKDSWHEFVLLQGPIAADYRELIGLGMAVVKQRGELIELHVHNALRCGASVEQVFEVLPIALLMDGAPALSQIPKVVAEIQGASKAAGLTP